MEAKDEVEERPGAPIRRSGQSGHAGRSGLTQTVTSCQAALFISVPPEFHERLSQSLQPPVRSKGLRQRDEFVRLGRRQRLATLRVYVIDKCPNFARLRLAKLNYGQKNPKLAKDC